MNKNQTPEQIARDKIDIMLEKAGWAVQSPNRVNHSSSIGVAVREYQTDIGPADYILFVNKKPVGVIEAKREEDGFKLSSVEEQSQGYARAKLKYFQNEPPLPFVYESTGTVTRFTDYRDEKARARNVFSFHRPETFARWLKQKKSLRENFFDLPILDKERLRPAQIIAIENLEESFKKNQPRALIQMATGAGKTFTATTFIYRLLKFAKAERILFLVDTKNLGEQAEQEFMTYQPTDDNRKFIELYNVQRLTSSHISSDSQVCISTIQRLYSILKGEEMDESLENENPNENTWLQNQLKKKNALPVEYNREIPIETFDFIIIDECHRSIYNLWKQVLDYFDAFLIGLTATPDKRTFGFFNENVVSEYTYEQSVLDGVNVPYDVYTIETDISKKGSKIEKGWFVDRRDKLTRKKRWQQEEDDTEYLKNDLDKKVVNISQIRSIIKEFQNSLRTTIFPNRIDEKGEYEVPKTLVFAKTDSHADDIITIIREVFSEGNDFCKKVTYKIEEDPKSLLNRFRNSYYPRIAVTVDMIATGTDVKPIEVLLFMRDVKSVNYFEQMKGRGTRTIPDTSLQMVTKTAKAKTHFVIVDAVGAIQSKKTDSRPLERKPGVPLKDLLGAVNMGVEDEDLFLSLANRLIRVDKQITEKQNELLLKESGGKGLKQIAKELISAFDPDSIEKKAEEKFYSLPKPAQTPEKMEELKKESQRELIKLASDTFHGKLNDLLDNIRRENEQIIDTINLDTVVKSEWNKDSLDRAKEVAHDFSEYLQKSKDEIQALKIFYNQPQNRKEITFQMIKEVFEKLKLDKPTLAPLYVWQAFTAIEKSQAKEPKNELIALISLIRHVCKIDSKLNPFDSTIDKNFQDWIFKQNRGKHNRFTPEQMDFLRLIKEHITSSFHIESEDLDYTPFDREGGRGKMFQLFGEDMDRILDEINEALVA